MLIRDFAHNRGELVLSCVVLGCAVLVVHALCWFVPFANSALMFALCLCRCVCVRSFAFLHFVGTIFAIGVAFTIPAAHAVLGRRDRPHC